MKGIYKVVKDTIKETFKIVKETFKIVKEIFNDDDLQDIIGLIEVITFTGVIIGLVIRLFKPSIRKLDRYYFIEEYSYQGFYNMRDRHNPLMRLKLMILDEAEYELYKLIYNNELKRVK